LAYYWKINIYHRDYINYNEILRRFIKMGAKNVLIPVINVSGVENALPDMVNWLKKVKDDVGVDLLYVAEVHDLDAATPTLKDMETKKVHLRKLADKFADHGFKANFRVMMGRQEDVILGEAAKSGVFTVLMAADGRRILPSKTIESIINKSSCPVVVFQPQLVKFTESVAAGVSTSSEAISAQIASSDTTKRVIIVTALWGIGSFLWYDLIFADLGLVNRIVLAKEFYSGIAVGVILLVTVSLYGTFIGKVLSLMGLDTKSTH
jgi:hypothetical protein